MYGFGRMSVRVCVYVCKGLCVCGLGFVSMCVRVCACVCKGLCICG